VRGYLIPGVVTAAVLVLLGLFIFPPARGISAPVKGFRPAQLQQAALPIHGWVVCSDLGFGPVDGVPQAVQRLLMCHGDGWMVQAYCTEPQKLAPAINTFCSMVSESDFWCGADVQVMRFYQFQQTAAPSPTPTATATATPTRTATPAPSLTNTAPSTLVTPQGGLENTPAPLATVFIRPHAGGNGTSGPLLAGLAAAAGLGLLAAAILIKRRG
jgi:hypothetical protein